MATFVELTELDGSKISINIEHIFYIGVLHGYTNIVKDSFLTPTENSVKVFENQINVKETYAEVMALIEAKTPRKSCCR